MSSRISLFLLPLIFACQPSVPVYDSADFSRFEAFELQITDLTEASGIAAGMHNRDILYSINDSGNGTEIFMLSHTAEDMGRLLLEGVKNRDWEDIVTGPGPGDENYIYVGEIGDNLAQYDIKYIYRFKEPKVTPGPDVNLRITAFDSIRFRFPDGKRDSEAILLEPATKDLYVFSKREDTVGIYLAKYPQPLNSIITLEKVGKLGAKNVVAGSISPDGQHVLIKTYDAIMYWTKRKDQPVYEVINSTAPVFLPYEVEPQGESITWHPSGIGFFTLSEEPGDHEASLYYYKR